MDEQREIVDLGGTMRLGAYAARLRPGSKVAQAYGKTEISERHRHRYEFNREYEELLTGAGLRITGSSPDGTYVEIVELPEHPYFLACQFHPEFKSRPERPHPLFDGFVAAAVALRGDRGSDVAAEATGAAEPIGGPGLAAPEPAREIRIEPTPGVSA